MATVTLVTYGGGLLVQEYLNALAAAVGTDKYTLILRLSIMMGGFWAAFQSVAQRNYLANVKWLLVYFVAMYIMFLPQVTVHIEDKVNPTEALAVDKVPLGLGVLASFTSIIGDAFTQLVNSNFSMPDDLKYNRTGMVMASQLMITGSELQITDARFSNNLQNFIHQCVFYDMMLGRFSLDTLMKQPDLWTFLQANASPARAFLYQSGEGTNTKNANQPSKVLTEDTVLTCQQGASTLSEDWTAAISEAETRYGQRLFGLSKDPKADLLKYLPEAYQFLLATKSASSADNLIQQSMLSNAIINAVPSFAAQAGATGGLNAYGFAKAQQHKRSTYLIMGQMAAYWLPLLKNAFEVVMYGAFLFVMALSLLPIGLGLIRNYLMSLFWLQLWGPCFALINLIVSFYAKYKGAAFAAVGAPTLGNVVGLDQINQDMVALAGYLSMSVPFLVNGFVFRRMSDVFTSLAQYVGGVTQSAASSAASDVVTGNISLGNTSMNNHTSDTVNRFHADDNLRSQSGQMSITTASGATLSASASGRLVAQTQGAISQLPVSVNMADALRSSVTHQAESAHASGLSEATSAVNSYTAGLRQIEDFATSQSHMQSSGHSSSMGENSSLGQSAREVSNIMESFEKAHNMIEGSSSELFGSLYLEGRAQGEWRSKDQVLGKAGSLISGLSYGFSGSGGAKGHKSWASNSQNNHLFNEAKRFASDHNFSQAVDNFLRASKESHYRTGDDQMNRLAKGATSSFDRASSLNHQASETFQQSDSLRQMASIISEDVANINTNATQEFYDWLADQSAPNAQGRLGAHGALSMAVNDVETTRHYAEQYIKEQSAGYLQKFEEQHFTSDKVLHDGYQHQSQSLESTREVMRHHEQYSSTVRQQAGQVDTGSSLTDSADKDAGELLTTSKSSLGVRGDNNLDSAEAIKSQVRQEQES